MTRGWRHRATPLERTVRVRDRRAEVTFEYVVGAPADYVFTIDIYSYLTRDHPAGHLGWWRFELPEGQGRAVLRLDFSAIRRASATLEAGGRERPVIDGWHNPDFALTPLGDLQIVFRDPAGEIRAAEPVLLKFLDRDVLRDFYTRQYAVQGYDVPRERPFLHDLHAYKLRRLHELFLAYFPPGSLVVDVGCGRSLFSEIGVRFPFRIVSGDLDFASVRDRAREVPHQSWSAFDAGGLPFGDARFDGLFAGEVIEHVPDARRTLREWNRVLKPGGVAIITTPTRERLLARVDGLERPYSRDHLSELSYRELSGPVLRDSGFAFVTQRCIYLELWLHHLFTPLHRVQDYLQSEGNLPGNRWAMRRLYPLGRLLPSLSLAMIVVARKVK
jgi:SAM-dependent methyltransferase